MHHTVRRGPIGGTFSSYYWRLDGPLGLTGRASHWQNCDRYRKSKKNWSTLVWNILNRSQRNCAPGTTVRCEKFRYDRLYISNQRTANFGRILNSTKMSLVGWAPCMTSTIDLLWCPVLLKASKMKWNVLFMHLIFCNAGDVLRSARRHRSSNKGTNAFQIISVFLPCHLAGIQKCWFSM